MTKVNIDWKSIQTIDGSQAKGFETLCVHLARAECPTDYKFIAKGDPDAGVECYAVLPNGEEWGWQAKYFNSFGTSQWRQIDRSVKKALEKHPALTRYIVCVPLDLPDPRIEGKQSAMDAWNKRVKKWESWAESRGTNTEFIYWGSSELLDFLVERHQTKLQFWFGATVLDKAWFSDRLEESINSVGPRYTPEIHQVLPIAEKFEAFGRTPAFFDAIKAQAKVIRKNIPYVPSFDSSKKHSVAETLEPFVIELNSCLAPILAQVGELEVQPVGNLPFHSISDNLSDAISKCGEIENRMRELASQYETESRDGKEEPRATASRFNPYRQFEFQLRKLHEVLWKAKRTVGHGATAAGARVMLIDGQAGTGKTHLLCDVARLRTDSDRPTILLMGNRFTSNDDPWEQARQQLSLVGLSDEEIVGSIEAAAEIAGCRALVLVDALNEGQGREIWRPHLAAFIDRLTKSRWIGVVMSIRSSYETIIPEEVKKEAFCITHSGFLDFEYDATKSFFAHYGLEFPTTPILSPEFSNPLFLKTLCRGLKATNQKRIPRGLHGFTAVFGLYLKGINEVSAQLLGLDPKRDAVSEALNALVKAMNAKGERWFKREEARSIVDQIHSAIDFENSLFRALIHEGLLIEDFMPGTDGEERVEKVSIAYERYADHLSVKLLLDSHLDESDPAASFEPGEGLAFFRSNTKYISPGMFGALYMQIAERTGRELVSLVPDLWERREMKEAFWESIIWRDLNSFTDETKEVFNVFACDHGELYAGLDVLLTVSMIPSHSLNATFLDNWLRRNTMPQRDAWWSIYLHRAWEDKGALDRIVDWALAVRPESNLDEDSVDLCANVLAWMLTASNRRLRDRSTKALVAILDGRLDSVSRLIDKFSELDDMYVVERVYAVAYGTAMRSNDPNEVGKLAACVFRHVFESGQPPVHVLLRDYARGVVERALSLNADIAIDEGLMRPSYNSNWPQIPEIADLDTEYPSLHPDYKFNSNTNWALDRIASSVMDGDFAWYVIGTNSPGSHWLSLRLDEPRWKSPQETLDLLIKSLSEQECFAWNKFKTVEEESNRKSFSRIIGIISSKDAIPAAQEGVPASGNADLDYDDEEVRGASRELESALTKEHLHMLQEVKERQKPNAESSIRFDLGLIQRYILWRVIELGWTADRFGEFDSSINSGMDRETHKVERIGKKYQWIAYHEIIAYISDHFQYRERFREDEGDPSYVGPWQEYFRDIDPSCTMLAKPGGRMWGGHKSAWWAKETYEQWGDASDPHAWVRDYKNLPNIEDLLVAKNPADESRWLNADGHFNWEQETPADRERYDLEERETWYGITGYLIPTVESETFMRWAEETDFWGRWMPEKRMHYGPFLGEHGWSSVSDYFHQDFHGGDDWRVPGKGSYSPLRTMSLPYDSQSSGFDCSADEGFALRLPTRFLLQGLGLKWDGNAADFVDESNRLTAFDPTAHNEGPPAFLYREESLRDYLSRERLSLCWALLGEKRVLKKGGSPTVLASMRISGAYMLGECGVTGFAVYRLDDVGKPGADNNGQVIGRKRTPEPNQGVELRTSLDPSAQSDF